MKRSLLAVIVLGGFCAIQTLADTYIGSNENSTSGSSVEGIGDFNDMIWEISGTNLTLNDLGGGGWSALSGVTLYGATSPTNAGAGSSTTDPFWNNASLDGANKNVGYCITTTNCGAPADVATGSTELLSVGGAQDTNFDFTVTGGATTVELAAVTGGGVTEVLGWSDPLNPSFNGTILTVGPTGTVTYNAGGTFTSPDGVFQLYFQFFSGGGTLLATNTTLSENSTNGGRFAMFDVNPSAVPEPATLALFGLGALALGLIPRLKKRG